MTLPSPWAELIAAAKALDEEQADALLARGLIDARDQQAPPEVTLRLLGDLACVRRPSEPYEDEGNKSKASDLDAVRVSLAVATFERTAGMRHVLYDIVTCRRRCSNRLLAVDVARENVSFMRVALGIDIERGQGATDPLTLPVRTVLAGSLFDAGEGALARREYEKIVKIARAAFGEGHDETAIAYSNQGRFFLNQGELKSAVKSFRTSIRCREKSGHADAAGDALEGLASSLIALGDRSAAVQLARAAMRTVEQKWGKWASRTIVFSVGIEDILREAGADDEADALRASFIHKSIDVQ
ncbi:MAG: tetratricopeptide repeat protein [Deltaproteobacteria bacterium]|nr:tetratricopeptide repeat protein [Deltaproteobacteria bacterium]